MSAYRAGKKMLLEIDFAGSGTFETLGGIVSRTITFEGSAVDVTNQDSEGNWQEMLAGVASKKVSISGEGKFKSGPAAVRLMQAWLNEEGQGFMFEVILPGLGTLRGPFVMGNLEYSGEQEDVMMASIALNSSGPLAFTAETSVGQ